jgi:hypothetical protein
VEAEVAEEVHGGDRVVHLVERPQQRDPVQRVVHAPLEEVRHEQEHDARGGRRSSQHATCEHGEEVAVDRDEAEVAQPPGPQQPLARPPGEEALEHEEDHADRDQPGEVAAEHA